MEEAFRRLKQALTSARIVKIVQPDAPFILETDASLIAIGAALKQVNAEDGKEYPVGFFSKALTGPERRYSVYEREMLAVVKACQHYRVFLIGRHFTVRADHKALRSIFHSKLKDSMRVEKWVLRLSKFDFTIEIIPGARNVVADALSRSVAADDTSVDKSRFEWLEDPADEYSDDEGEVEPDNSADLCAVEVEIGDNETRDLLEAPSIEEFRQAQRNDPECSRILTWIRLNQFSKGDDLQGLPPFLRMAAESADQSSEDDGVLMYQHVDGAPVRRIVVPPPMIDRVIQYYHTGPVAAHESAGKVSARIATQYYWPHAKRDIAIYIAACEVCYKFRRISPTPRAELEPIRVGSRSELVALDVVGGKSSLPTTKRGNKYILTIIDTFTKYVVAVPLKDQSASSVSSAFL